MDWMKKASPLSLIAALVLFACAGSKDNLDITKPITGDAATNAAKAYQLGLDQTQHRSYLDAVRYFEWVKNNFPYSQYAALSELAMADMEFVRDDFASAASAYAEFVKAHPSHPKAAYAAFRVGVSQYNDRQSEWFLLPPAAEREQAPLHQALDALQKFTLGYPNSEYVPEAKRLINECRIRLAAHERYVAGFYFKRNAWSGAANRYLTIADQYGDLENGNVRGDALWKAAQAFQNLGKGPQEKEALTRLVQEAPGDPHYGDARKRLAKIEIAQPPPSNAKEREGVDKNREKVPPPPTPSTQPSTPGPVPEPAPR